MNAKVIDNEGKHDGLGGVPEEAGGVASFNETSGKEFADELFVGKVRSLGQAIHAAINLDVNKTVVGDGQKVVFIDEALGKDRERKLGKLGTFHLLGGEEIVGEIKGQETGIRGGDNTVEQHLRSVKFSSFGGDLIRVIDAVAAGRGTDAAGLSFEGPVSYN